MTEHCLWRFSRALHRAINERRHDEVEDLIDDDVDWAIYGPIDMFPFLGARRGKAAVLEVLRQIADNIRVRRFDRETIMLGADSAASMLRYSLTALDSDKPISLRIAHFAQFKAGKLASIRILVDTFDLVEQALAVRSTCRRYRRSPDRHGELVGCKGAPAPCPPLLFAHIGGHACAPLQFVRWNRTMPGHNFATMCTHPRPTWNAGGL